VGAGVPRAPGETVDRRPTAVAPRGRDTVDSRERGEARPMTLLAGRGHVGLVRGEAEIPGDDHTEEHLGKCRGEAGGERDGDGADPEPESPR